MLTAPPSRWTVQGLTFLLWGLAAAAAVYWGLKLGTGSAATAPAAVPARGAVVADPAAIARLLGSGPGVATAAPVPSLASRFSLVGIATGRSRTSGVALISVDGKPAKPFRVGSTIDEGLLLQAVEGRRAVLAASLQGPPVLTLELPPVRR
jgi:general secretion pathway protein C